MVVLRSMSRFWFFLSILFCSIAGNAAADQTRLYPKGQRALLDFSLQIEGVADQRLGQRDEGVKWSTLRSIEASLELTADAPNALSATINQDLAAGREPDHPAATLQQAPPPEVRDLQKQLDACGKDDIGCQMRLAMKLMGTQHVQAQLRAGDELAAMSPRYQVWRASSGGLREIRADYQEHWETVFYTAARETADCRLKAPAVSPALPETAGAGKVDWTAMNRQALDGNARSLLVEVDGQTGGNRLHLRLPGQVFADQHCTSDIGNGPTETRTSRQVSFQPPLQLESDWIDGDPAAGDVIAAGTRAYDLTTELGNLNVGFNAAAKVPLRVKLRWQLTLL